MKFNLLLLCILMTTITAGAQNFKAQQQKFERVKNAYTEKWPSLSAALKTAGFKSGYKLFIAAYKNEGVLEVWLMNKGAKSYKLFKSYPFCAHSGTLGPKVKEGDEQTPEGFYYINVFNPMSSFHLSLGINYPNATDLVRSGKEKPGNDIYIHGACVTVGCIPLTDDLIKEVYVLAVEAKDDGQEQIDVHIYPFRMTAANMKKFTALYPAQNAFWNTLSPEYNYFDSNKITR